MLLLDHNLPHQLRDLLTEFGVPSESTRYRGWETLRNGDLVSAACSTGFKAIITRDQKFAESAAKALKKFPEMAVIVIRLNQRSWRTYREAFRAAWIINPIVLQSGRVTEWPSTGLADSQAVALAIALFFKSDELTRFPLFESRGWQGAQVLGLFCRYVK